MAGTINRTMLRYGQEVGYGRSIVFDCSRAPVQICATLALGLQAACVDPGSQRPGTEGGTGEGEGENDDGVTDIPEGCMPGPDEVIILDGYFLTDGKGQVPVPRSMADDDGLRHDLIWRDSEGDWQVRTLERRGGCLRATGVSVEHFWYRSIRDAPENNGRTSVYSEYNGRLIDRRGHYYAPLDAVRYTAQDDPEQPFLRVGLPEGTQDAIEKGSGESFAVICPEYGGQWGDLLGGSSWSETERDTLELMAPRMTDPEGSMGVCTAIIEQEQLSEADGWSHHSHVPAYATDVGEIRADTGHLSLERERFKAIERSDTFSVDWDVASARELLTRSHPNLTEPDVDVWLWRDVVLSESRSGSVAIDGWYRSARVLPDAGPLAAQDYALPQLELPGLTRASVGYGFSTPLSENKNEPSIYVSSSDRLVSVEAGDTLRPRIFQPPTDVRIAGRSVSDERPALSEPLDLKIEVDDEPPNTFYTSMTRYYWDNEAGSMYRESVRIYSPAKTIELPEVMEGERGNLALFVHASYCPEGLTRADDRCAGSTFSVSYSEAEGERGQNPSTEERRTCQSRDWGTDALGPWPLRKGDARD